MKLKEFSNKAKILLILVLLVVGSIYIVLKSKTSIDINTTPGYYPVLQPEAGASSSPKPILSETSISPSVRPSPSPLPKPSVGQSRCKATGCSGQICSEEEVVTTCEFKEEYACYKTAVCERQEDGKCGWTPTEELVACLTAVWQTEFQSQ